MKTFREYIVESNDRPTVNNVKKFLKSIDFSIILPENLDVSERKYSGGGKGIRIIWESKPGTKNVDDIELMIKSLQKEYTRVDYTQGNSYLIVMVMPKKYK